MDNSIADKLDDGISKGHKAQHAYDYFFKPFLTKKRKILFIAFQDTSARDVEGLMEIKRMMIALDALEQEMQTYINTGKMAEIQLSTNDKH